jgi:hypothetical protein
MPQVTVAAVSGIYSSVTERSRFQTRTRVPNEINSTGTLDSNVVNSGDTMVCGEHRNSNLQSAGS